ncbi:MAG: TIGR02221 family CRISPR-associated protein [bacterium]
MSKILITSLGSGNKSSGYSKANYSIGGKTYEDKEFIAEALAEHLNIDKIYFFGTRSSIWDSVYKNFSRKIKNSNNSYSYDIESGLYEKIDSKSLNENDLELVSDVIDEYIGIQGSKCFIIDYGLNDAELWNNFKKFLEIANFTNNNDEIYLDITHSFRSLAIMSFIMVQFIEQIKNLDIKVEGIYYGMFEYSKENDGITPVIDLKMFYILSLWIRAINNFKHYGNGGMIYELIKDDSSIEKEVKDVFTHFNNNISLGNVNNIKEAVQIIQRRMDAISSSSDPIIKEFLLPGLDDFIGKLTSAKTESIFQYNLSIWYYEIKNYALSYIILSEAIITKICEIKKTDTKDIDARKTAKNTIKGYEFNKVNEIYENVSKIRNSIAHETALSGNAISSINNLHSYLEKLEKFFMQ